MSLDKIYFDKKKETRGWYFVEYNPPIDESFRFAMVQLSILENVDKAKIIEAMESEARIWLAKYPVPVRVSAFDDKDDLVHLEPIKPCDDLIGLRSDPQGNATLYWRPFTNTELPITFSDRNALIKIFHDIPFRRWTTADMNQVQKKQKRTVVFAWSIVFVWLVIVPLTVIILGETSVWVSRMVLTYSLWQVLVQLLKLTGRWKKSPQEEEKEQDEREKDHHHYHCKKNPQGFLKLKVENYEKEARERVKKEAEVLKSQIKN